MNSERTLASLAVRCAGSNYPFLTLKERDVETGLDYFLARYYSSTQGRFTSPDPLLESSEKSQPQSWNRYSITINNPLKYVDPDGLRYVQRTLPDGTIEYGWCATDACYDQAIDTSAKDYAGWTPVTFDESQPYTYRTTPGIGGELYSSYTLNPDGTHGFTRILEGGSAGLTTDWGAQLAIGGIFKSLFSLLDAGIESLGTRATTTAVTTEAVASWPGPGGGRVIIRGIEYTEHALERMVPRGLGGRGVPPSVVENAIQHGTRTVGNQPGTLVFTFENVRIVTNAAANRVITVITTGR